MKTVSKQKEVKYPYETPAFEIVETGCITQMLAQSDWIPYDDEPGDAD